MSGNKLEKNPSLSVVFNKYADKILSDGRKFVYLEELVLGERSWRLDVY